MPTDPIAMGYRRTTGRTVRLFCTDTGAALGTATVAGVHHDHRTGRKLIELDTGAIYSLGSGAERGGQTRFAFAD